MNSNDMNPEEKPKVANLPPPGALGISNVRRWILVAGSGRRLSDKLVKTCEQFGQELAEADFGLVTGGWPGVDYFVAKAFAEKLKADTPLSSRLIQCMKEGDAPEFHGGQHVTAPTDGEAWQMSIEKADAVVLLGGLGGTLKTGEMALRLRKPVLPVAGTSASGHKDANKFYSRILENWGVNPIAGITREDYESLKNEMPAVASDIVRLLKLHFSLGADIIKPEIHRFESPVDSRFDSIVRVLVDGNEKQRADLLTDIIGYSTDDKHVLAGRLRQEITDRFGPQFEADTVVAERDKKLLPSIRSWMLSCIIWADPEEELNRNLILTHLDVAKEPNVNVRFWTLAGLYQRKVSYLSRAVEKSITDPGLEVATLARVISRKDNSDILQSLKTQLKSEKFKDVWSVLRVLRIIPIPELIEDLCLLLDKSRQGESLSYDVLYALCQPRIAHDATRILTGSIGLEKVIRLLLEVARDSNDNAARKFSYLLVRSIQSKLTAHLKLRVRMKLFTKLPKV
ncbi:MAG: hypothetical protein WCO56_15575 [Verrucomicrobiota bacterium]